MKYQLHITQSAERDLIQAADYIEFVLKNPQAADDLLAEADKKIMRQREEEIMQYMEIPR